MERLTEKGATYITCDNEHDIIVKISADGSEEPLYDLEDICAKLNRLAELEDKIERNELLELPCTIDITSHYEASVYISQDNKVCVSNLVLKSKQ